MNEKNKKNINVQNNPGDGCLTVFLKLWFRTFIVSSVLYLLSQLFSSGDNYVINRQSKIGQPMFNTTTQEQSIDYSNEVVLSAMYNNSLSNEEKMLVASLSQMISENPYIDKDRAKQQLSEIEIEYTKKDSRYRDSIAGLYDYNTNTIKMFSEKEKTSKRNVAHELVHGVFYNEKTTNAPSFVREGATQVLVDEYLSKVPCYEEGTYPFEVTGIKLLCEMTDSNTVLKAYTTGDMREIKYKLSKVMDYNETELFIANMEDVFKAHREGQEVSLEKLASVIKYADSYFKNNNSSTEKLEAYNYYRGILQQLGTDEPKVGLNMYLSEKGIYVKPYFSKKLKANYEGSYYYDYRTASNIRNGKEAKEYIKC